MKTKDFVLGAFIGSVVGAVTAILLAPKPGREVRADIAFQVEALSEKTKDLANITVEKTQQIANEVSGKTKEIASVLADKSQVIASAVAGKTQEIAKTVGSQTSQWAGKASGLADTVVDEVKSWREQKNELTAEEEAVIKAEKLKEIEQ